MKKGVICVIIFLLCLGIAGAREKVFIDKTEIQEYKGRLGKWMMMSSSAALVQVAREFGSTVDEIHAINENPGRKMSHGTYFFIPYSQSTLKNSP